MNTIVKRTPVRRAVVGVKPKIVIPLAAVAELSGGSTNYKVVIERYRKKIKNPKSAIRAKCVECSGGSLKEVQECRVFKCALYPFRMGENPFHLSTKRRLAAERGEVLEEDENTEDDE